MATTCRNKELLNWVADVRSMVKPDKIVWCDGSKAEYAAMIKMAVDANAAIPLKKRPNSYLSAAIPVMWRVLRTAPISPREPGKKPARPTTGSTRSN